jgi:anti-anti-sigma factor
MSDDSIHQLVVHEHDGRVVVAILGEVDQSNAESIEHELRTAAHGKPLVVDLRSTAYFDSAGVAMMHTLRQNTDLSFLVAPDSIVRRVLEITGLDLLVPVLSPADAAAVANDEPESSAGR